MAKLIGLEIASTVRASMIRNVIPVHYAQSARGRERGAISRSPEDLSPSLPSGKGGPGEMGNCGPRNSRLIHFPIPHQGKDGESPYTGIFRIGLR